MPTGDRVRVSGQVAGARDSGLTDDRAGRYDRRQSDKSDNVDVAGIDLLAQSGGRMLTVSRNRMLDFRTFRVNSTVARPTTSLPSG